MLINKMANNSYENGNLYGGRSFSKFGKNAKKTSPEVAEVVGLSGKPQGKDWLIEYYQRAMRERAKTWPS